MTIEWNGDKELHLTAAFPCRDSGYRIIFDNPLPVSHPKEGELLAMFLHCCIPGTTVSHALYCLAQVDSPSFIEVVRELKLEETILTGGV